MDDDRRGVLDSPFVIRAARWGIVAWATAGVLGLVALFFWFVIYPVRIIFPPLVVAMIVVYLLNPIVTGLERRRFRRLWAALLVYVVGGAIVGTALYFLVPLVAEQGALFGERLPGIIDRAASGFEDVLGRLGVDVGGAAAPPDTQTISDFFRRFVSLAQSIFEVAIIFVLGPILGFYFLVDLPKIKRQVRAMIPARRRGEVESILRKIGEAIGGFFRGQLLVALFVGLASSLGLLIVGLPFWAVVGMVAGLFNLIPLIGPFIGGAVAILIAVTTEEPAGGLLGLEPGWQLAVGSSIALLVVQQIDNHILSPNIVGRTVRLHPVTVMLGLLAGGALLGLWGMLLAIPTIAAVKILVLHAWDTRVTWPPEPEQGAGGAEPVATAPATETTGPVPMRPAPPADPPAAVPSGGGGWVEGLRRLFSRRPTEPGPGPKPAPTSPGRGA